MIRDKAIQLIFYWQYGSDKSSFFSLIITAYAKADGRNKTRLQLAFPELCSAYDEWFHSPDSDEFFRLNGFTLPGEEK